MSNQNLLDYFNNLKPREKKSTESASAEKKSPAERKKVVYPDFPKDLPPSYLVSVTYEGKKALASLKLYEPESQKIYFWDDTTGHKPYCLTNLPPKELEKISRLTSHSGFDHFEIVEKFDPLMDKQVKVTKVVAKDPLAIGGRQYGNSILVEEIGFGSGITEAITL